MGRFGSYNVEYLGDDFGKNCRHLLDIYRLYIFLIITIVCFSIAI